MVKSLVAEFDKDNCRAAQEKKLKELYLAQKAINTILYEKNIPIDFFEVKIIGDKAVLNGSVKTADDIDIAAETVKEITGVKEIENDLSPENFKMSYDMGMEFFNK
ncbi:MAG: BON domain-containing protein [Spirochaetia bacterium]|nr:BON domain-containing protein [Spirochaetia bacterium]